MNTYYTIITQTMAINFLVYIINYNQIGYWYHKLFRYQDVFSFLKHYTYMYQVHR